MPFTAPPRLSYAGRGLYLTDAPCEYDGATDRVTIPAGYRTDLASVPRLFWALIPPHGAYEAAAVLHDHLCDELARARRAGRSPSVSARDTDGLFRRVMRECGVGPITRWVMWCGVRWGALGNPARRAGIGRDLPLVGAITVALLAAVAVVVYAADAAVHTIGELW